MQNKKVFITGASGYIGSAILIRLQRGFESSQFQIVALLRNETPEFASQHPNVRVLKGDFDDYDKIHAASAASDIVIHGGWSDHLGSAQACLEGLRTAAAADGRRRFYIHLSGTGCIADMETNDWTGRGPTRAKGFWNDVTDIEEIRQLPDEAMHRNVDGYIFKFGQEHNALVATAIVAPGTLYGSSDPDVGEGSLTRRSTVYLDNLSRLSKQRGRAFVLGQGENLAASVDMRNVADVFELLIRRAAFHDGQGADWGSTGFYFIVDDHIQPKGVAQKMATMGKQDGWLKDDTVDSLTEDDIKAMAPPGKEKLTLYFFGANSTVEAHRARALGWVPRPSTYLDQLETDIQSAVEKLKG